MERNRDIVPVLSAAMGTSSLSSTETVLPATVPEAEGMGRERKVRGFHSYDSGKGKASGRGSAPSSHG